MHLDQATLFRYVQDMQRLLKPGGVVFYDGLDLTGSPGWDRFWWEVEHYR